MQFLLTRDDLIPPAPDHLFGRLTVGMMTFQTMELPWVPVPDYPCGEPTRSCVPVGTYALVLHDTLTHPKTWALVNPDLCIYHEPADIPMGTVGRSACLLHSGNLARDSEGCVLVGQSRGTLDGQPAILASQAALTLLKSVVPWTLGHTLTIT